MLSGSSYIYLSSIDVILLWDKSKFFKFCKDAKLGIYLNWFYESLNSFNVIICKWISLIILLLIDKYSKLERKSILSILSSLLLSKLIDLIDVF